MEPVDFDKVVPTKAMCGDNAKDTLLLRRMLLEAEAYLRSHSWCKAIRERYFGLGVGGIVAVFLFRIEPVRNDVDHYLWVVVGDLPSLYITTDDAPNPACALDRYIGAMEDWAEAAANGLDVSECAPVSAAATKENGLLLRKRLRFLDRELLSHYQDDLRQHEQEGRD